MSDAQLLRLISKLAELPDETEWVEFKMNRDEPHEIGEYISALSNSAALSGKARGYVVWGVEDGTHELKGTTFRPAKKKVGNEDLENWLATQLTPRIGFRFREASSEDRRFVVLEIPKATHLPVRFKGEEYVRCGSYKKKLSEHPDKERALWRIFSQEPFEKRLALDGLELADAVRLLDYSRYFDMTSQSQPFDLNGIASRLGQERLIARQDDGTYAVTNLGAILFAKDLGDFEDLSRKALRVVIYRGRDRTETLREQAGVRGYAVGFAGAIQFILDQLPENEVISEALRETVRMYPDIAIRELVANALIHQDFDLSGTGPLVELFDDRLEVSNPGKPLIDTLRFIDEPPRSRNEALAAFMRRLNICEERGSGIDKVVRSVEVFQLPGPDFRVSQDHMVAVLYAHKSLREMDRDDKIRGCYQHAALRCVSNDVMTNSSLRERFGIEQQNYSLASRIIADTVDAGLIRRYDPESKSRKHARYVPFWA